MGKDVPEASKEQKEGNDGDEAAQGCSHRAPAIALFGTMQVLDDEIQPLLHELFVGERLFLEGSIFRERGAGGLAEHGDQEPLAARTSSSAEVGAGEDHEAWHAQELIAGERIVAVTRNAKEVPGFGGQLHHAIVHATLRIGDRED
jgi:hypothetical protein